MRIFVEDPGPIDLDPRGTEIVRRFIAADLLIIAAAIAEGFTGLARAMCHLSSFQVGADGVMGPITEATGSMVAHVLTEYERELIMLSIARPELTAHFAPMITLAERAEAQKKIRS